MPEGRLLPFPGVAMDKLQGGEVAREPHVVIAIDNEGPFGKKVMLDHEKHRVFQERMAALSEITQQRIQRDRRLLVSLGLFDGILEIPPKL